MIPDAWARKRGRSRAAGIAGAAFVLLALQPMLPAVAQTGGGPDSEAVEPGGLAVETAEFLVVLTDGEGGRQAIASTLVPYLPNRACFGWRIRLAEAPAMVRLREVLQLPTAPAFWSGEDDAYSPHKYSADRTTATTEQFAAPKDGWIGSSWCIVEGDPVGAHSIEVFIDDRLIRHFDFEVKRPANGVGN
jgi:hypothetical protein